jgi:hypothetical protein
MMGDDEGLLTEQDVAGCSRCRCRRCVAGSEGEPA